MKREKFSSRVGFILISAGCAIGLGNVWRFPYVVGKYGGAAFVLIYLVFLILLGLPIMVMEFAVGRSSRQSAAAAFRVLERKGSHWHRFSYIFVAGNYLLMMFYTTIGGWMLAYFVKMIQGKFLDVSVRECANIFQDLTAQPLEMIFWMSCVVFISFGICSLGLQKGVEKITKFMMSGLLFIMLILTVRVLSLSTAKEGLLFYLKPDFTKMEQQGIFHTVFAAMGQAFFTLSIGIGSMTVFGSYIGKERSLTGESLHIMLLDTFVAVMSGLIIFPACFAFGVKPDSGVSLVFITLPNVFNAMGGGRIWGALFFLFMSFAAMSTIVAVFENLLSFAMDLWNWERKKAVIANLILVLILSLPCIFGFNVWSGFCPLGAGSNIMDLEDFIVSNNLLPLGSLVYLAFCVSKNGWGWENFLQEANMGKGMKFPKWLKNYVRYMLPLIILFVFVQGYFENLHA